MTPSMLLLSTQVFAGKQQVYPQSKRDSLVVETDEV